jgi:cell wall-associated NlpC family hydrolase
MVEWIADTIPWGIVSTDGKDISPVLWMDDNRREPLMNREFISGVQDCYSIVRDYYLLERGIEIKNFPRSFDWWQVGEDHYSKNFENAGFKAIPRNKATTGDVLLYKIRSAVICHASVLTGPNTILHHLVKRKSCLQKRSDWARFEALAVRYYGT